MSEQEKSGFALERKNRNKKTKPGDMIRKIMDSFGIHRCKSGEILQSNRS